MLGGLWNDEGKNSSVISDSLQKLRTPPENLVPGEKPTMNEGTEILQGIGVVELLQQDSRPTFIVDLASHIEKNGGSYQVLFCNHAFQDTSSLYLLLFNSGAKLNLPSPVSVTSEFQAWALNTEEDGESELSFIDSGLLWNRLTFNGHLRLVRGTPFGQRSLVIHGKGLHSISDMEPRRKRLKLSRDQVEDLQGLPNSQLNPKDQESHKEADHDRLNPRLDANGIVSSTMKSAAYEKLQENIIGQRLEAIQQFGDEIATAKNLKIFWNSAARLFSRVEDSTPIAAFYTIRKGDFGETALASSEASLEFSFGLAPGQVAAPKMLDLTNNKDGLGAVFTEVIQTRKLVLLQKKTGTLPISIYDELKWQGDKCNAAVVGPLIGQASSDLLGFFFMAISPHMEYDDPLRLFIQLLANHFALGLSLANLRQRRAHPFQNTIAPAYVGYSDFSKEVTARTLEAAEAEAKFRIMADLISVGMFIINPNGAIMYANPACYNITGHSVDDYTEFSWANIVAEEYAAHVQEEWRKLALKVIPTSSEIPMKKQWSQGGLAGPAWVLASAFPEVDPDGTVKWIMGTITDISHQKAVESLLKRKTEELINWKTQQERFIDMTSHEIRNPMSAIIQCADEISLSFTNLLQTSDHSAQLPNSVLDSSIDAAKTIAMCAQHQTRIIDDIGTLSKLDSELISLEPANVQLVPLVQTVLKMFQKEAQQNQIEMVLIEGPSLKEQNVDRLRLDPNRLIQVIINLLTNAIKFTKHESSRKIIITLGTFLKPPLENTPGIVFPSDEQSDRDPTTQVDWGTGELIYLQVTVTDSGVGLTAEEKEKLFQRFVQASPRTHVKYGGSGLGLFISRRLTELQGGHIGVASEAGLGTTFAFYIKARRPL